MQSMSQSITQSSRIRSLSGLIFVYAYERQTADGRDEGQHAIARLSPIIETNITSIYSNQRFIVASTFQVDARFLLWLSASDALVDQWNENERHSSPSSERSRAIVSCQYDLPPLNASPSIKDQRTIDVELLMHRITTSRRYSMQKMNK